jgi:hypothetical protein
MPSKLESRVTQHDREIAAIRKLILQGMKMLVENGTQIKENAAQIKVLATTVDRFVRSLERGAPNGHSKAHLR